MIIINFNKYKAIQYANKWSLKRNPNYYDFSNIGGDCTNFVSQCVFSANNVMNFTPITGWYYNSANDRSASWTSVEYFYKFLVSNKSFGPFATIIEKDKIQPADIIQLGNSDGIFYHSLFISDIINNVPMVSAHSFDAYKRPLYTYSYENIRYIKIIGVRI